MLRANFAPKAMSESVALDAMRRVAADEGHPMGQPETRVRRKSDLVRPDLADRRAIGDREGENTPLEEAAAARVAELSDCPPAAHPDT